MTKKFVLWFREVGKHDGAQVGGKGANLGEMMHAGVPVPDGFIVTAQAYFTFIEASGIKSNIQAALAKLNVADQRALEKASETVKKLIITAKIPDDIAQSILNAYLALGKRFGADPFVAVRSSATAEDLPGASFAGQQETFLNIRGDANVVNYVRRAWASLFTPRAIFYRTEKKFDHFKVGIAVPVQKMVQSTSSGVMFTIDPINNDKNKITIEGILGLGEMIVQGAVTPDHFELDKKTLEITNKTLSSQATMMTLIGHKKTKIIPVPKNKREKQKISDQLVIEIAKLGKKLEKHYYFPQDIEWAVEGGEVFITQTRPVTTMKETASKQADTHIDLPQLAQGHPASPGIGSGPVKIALTAKDIKKVMAGDVLAAPQTNPDYVPAMRKVAAIITEHGGRTSHAAIVSRELGIPAVVGAADVLKKLKDGLVVTVDGKKGAVYKGGLSTAQVASIAAAQVAHTTDTKPIKTATKVYVNLADSGRVEEIAKRQVDGVGLLRAEFMIADIGTHPKKLIAQKRQQVFVDALAEKLTIFAKHFNPRPVVYRATDFKTNEYRGLKGGAEYEPQESNPMMGYRGAYRYVADADVFNLELAAIQKVRNKGGFKNLWLMIPYVHTPQELLKVKQMTSAFGLHRSSNFRLWLMVEIPINVILIDDFLSVGIDGVSIGSNDLTQLTMGIDRDNSEVAQVFDERNPALLWSFERVIKACHKHNVTASICGQAPSDYPELVEKLVELGITSISVNPDMLEQVRQTIAHAEHKLVTHKKK